MQLTDMQATIIHSCPDLTDICVSRREGSGCGLEGRQWVWFGGKAVGVFGGKAVGVVWREASGCGLEGCTPTLKQWVWFGGVTEAVQYGQVGFHTFHEVSVES